MSVYLNDISSVVAAYKAKDYDALSQNLNNIDIRLKFEEWLFQNFSPDEASSSEFAWQSRVLSLICTKIGKEAAASVDVQEKEDRCLAKLISKSEQTENQPIALKLNDLFKKQFPSASEKMLDVAQIQAEIHTANLPVTCL